MLEENVQIHPVGDRLVSLSWTSVTETARSWVFINGKFAVGPFMGDAKERSMTLKVPENSTFVVDVHDFDDDTVPSSIEEAPGVRPMIGWNAVESARGYRVYFAFFGEEETLLCEVPPYAARMEIASPVRLDGCGGRWYRFRIVAVDQYGNESPSEIVPYFATDLPVPPQILVTKDVQTNLLNFSILPVS